MDRFTDKAVIVSGVASGIGRATAERLAQEGAQLYLLDVMLEGLEDTAKHCVELGAGAVETQVCDVSQPDQVEAAVEGCVARYGKLDVLVNIAGILLLEHTHETTLEDWNRIINVNLTGTFLICKAALPHLLDSKGVIVNTSSTSALAGMPYGAAYGASKAGVLAFTKTLAVEYAKKGLRAVAVCPGSVKTAMTSRSKLPKDMDFSLIQRAMPLDEARGPECVASVIAMLASADGAHINGESILIDGGTLA